MIEDNIIPALRIEWCRVRARAMRWSEEVPMLREEMRRVLEYLSWHAGWWINLGNNTLPGLSGPDREGASAYAYKQACYRQVLRSKFDGLWEHCSELASSGIGGKNDILDLDEAASSYLVDTPLVSGTCPLLLE